MRRSYYARASVPNSLSLLGPSAPALAFSVGSLFRGKDLNGAISRDEVCALKEDQSPVRLPDHDAVILVRWSLSLCEVGRVASRHGREHDDAFCVQDS